MIVNGKRLLVEALILLAALICPLPTATAQDMPTEQTVRAAMVFNFLKFTEFPPRGIAAARGLRLCVAVDESRQAEALAALSGRRVGGRELTVADFTAQGSDCNVLYVDSRQRWNAIAELDALHNVLTISAFPGFVRDGGMIEIDVQPDGTRFDINLAKARYAGIHFAPQVLRLARHVYE